MEENFDRRECKTADRLKQIMNERNLRQVDILKLCEPYAKKYGVNVSKSLMSTWISGINEPNNDKLAILSMALGVSEPWLMGFDVPKFKEDVKRQAEQDAEMLLKYRKLNAMEKKIVNDMIDSLLKNRE